MFFSELLIFFTLPIYSQTPFEVHQSYECPRLQRIIDNSNNEVEINNAKGERFNLNCSAYDYEQLRKSFNNFMRIFK